MYCSRNPVTARCETIRYDGGEVRDSGVKGYAGEDPVFNVGQGHEQPVVLQEADRCVSHNCSDPKHSPNALPPSLATLAVASSDQNAELPASLGQVLGSVGGKLRKLGDG